MISECNVENDGYLALVGCAVTIERHADVGLAAILMGQGNTSPDGYLQVRQVTRAIQTHTWAPTMPLPPKKRLEYMCMEPPLPMEQPSPRPTHSELEIQQCKEHNWTKSKQSRSEWKVEISWIRGKGVL